MNNDESLLDKKSEFIADLGLYVVHLEKHQSDGAFHLPRNSEFELAMFVKASYTYILAHLHTYFIGHIPTKKSEI